MKVSQLLNQDKVTLSFEVFPPKTSSSYESVAHATQEIAAPATRRVTLRQPIKPRIFCTSRKK